MIGRGRALARGKGAIISLLSVAVFVAAWQLVSGLEVVSPLILPPPARILEAGYEIIRDGYHHASLFAHVGVSLTRAVTAFALAVALGVPLGLAMGLFPPLASALEPFVQFLRPLPKIALIPLAILWLGIGEVSKIFLIFLSTLFTVVVGSAASTRSVGLGKLRLAAALGASSRQVLWRFVLPAALPEIFTAVRLAIGVGWTTLIAAEMVAAESGMGWMVLNASSYMRTDIVMLGIILLGGAGYALDWCLAKLDTIAAPWAGKE
jgi:taurine transport system permease protein